jgi:hypothetical protein
MFLNCDFYFRTCCYRPLNIALGDVRIYGPIWKLDALIWEGDIDSMEDGTL